MSTLLQNIVFYRGRNLGSGGKSCVSVKPETDSSRSAKILQVGSGTLRAKRSVEHFIKFTLAANVPQNAYIDTSLPRWS